MRRVPRRQRPFSVVVVTWGARLLNFTRRQNTVSGGGGSNSLTRGGCFPHVRVEGSRDNQYFPTLPRQAPLSPNTTHRTPPRSTPCLTGCKYWWGAVPNVLTLVDGNRRVITESLGDRFFLFSTLSSFFPFFLHFSHTLSLLSFFSLFIFLFFHKPFPPITQTPKWHNII